MLRALTLQDESLYVFPNCKSLWIKASAKWLNLNVNVNVNWTGVVWITCRVLWDFYQLFGPSFWWHPFTAKDPLVSKWYNFSKSVLTKKQTHLHLGWPERKVNLHFWVNYFFKYITFSQVATYSLATKVQIFQCNQSFNWIQKFSKHIWPHTTLLWKWMTSSSFTSCIALLA